MITSKAQLINYIRQMLGEPTIQVEVTNDQIALLIDETIGIYADVVYGDFEETMILPATALDSRFRARLMNFTSVLTVTPVVGCPSFPPVSGNPSSPDISPVSGNPSSPDISPAVGISGSPNLGNIGTPPTVNDPGNPGSPNTPSIPPTVNTPEYTRDFGYPQDFGIPGYRLSGDHIQGKREFHFHWNNISRTLTITGFPVPSYMMVVGLTKYKAQDEEDYIFDETWVKAMAKAKTQKLWGQVVGKYSQSLVSGATINFDRIISEAETEIDRLMEELQEKWMDPAPVLVG